MRAVVFQHEEREGPGRIRPALERVGFHLTTRFRGVQRGDLEADVVVVMGGDMGVADVEAHPFLEAERALLSERLALGRPCLGVCLGAQLLAAAAGAEVFRGKNGLEVGASPVQWLKAARDDSVVGAVGAKTVAAHWHRDTFTPVPGATLLASTERYTQQAFRLGPSFGFQFHLELGADDFSAWLRAGEAELEAAAKPFDQLLAQLPKLRAAEPAWEQVLNCLAEHFARAGSAAG